MAKLFDKAIDETLKVLRSSDEDLPFVTTRAQGGKVMAGGISTLPDKLVIHGQPHQLSYIRPDEAETLKSMGGSGKKVGGIPAYFYDAGLFDNVSESGDASDFSFSEEDYMIGRGPDYHEAMGSQSPIPAPTLKPEPDLTKKTYPEYTPINLDERVRANLARYDDVGFEGYEKTYLNELWNKYGKDAAYKQLALAQALPGGIAQLKEGFSEGYRFGGPAGTAEDVISTGLESYIESALDRKDRELIEKKTTDADKYGEETSIIGAPGYELGELIEQGLLPGMSYEQRKEVKNPFESLGLAKYIAPGGMVTSGIVGLLNALGDLSGIVGYVTIGGREYGVTKDGKIVDTQTPETPDEGNIVRDKDDYYGESIPSITTKEEDEENEKIGLKSFLAKRGPTTTRASLDALMKERLKKLYGRDIFV